MRQVSVVEVFRILCVGFEKILFIGSLVRICLVPDDVEMSLIRSRVLHRRRWKLQETQKKQERYIKLHDFGSEKNLRWMNKTALYVENFFR